MEKQQGRLRKNWILLVAVSLAALSLAQAEDPPVDDIKVPETATVTIVPVSVEPNSSVSVTIARDRAKTMYQIYSSTLDVLHDHYFHANRAVLPARAMEDIFSDGEAQSGVKTRWIAVNAKAMSVDHEPSNDFEKQASQQIAAGEKQLEQIDGNTYRFAGSIPLHENCVQCHMGTLIAPPKKARFAGLVISIPLDAESLNPE